MPVGLISLLLSLDTIAALIQRGVGTIQVFQELIKTRQMRVTRDVTADELPAAVADAIAKGGLLGDAAVGGIVDRHPEP